MNELAEIVTRGIDASQMTIRPEAVRKITALSQGLPHYTQLLTQLAAQAALAQRRIAVAGRDVDLAVGRALDRAQPRTSRTFARERSGPAARPATAGPWNRG